MLEYARWKYILVAAVLAVALLFALPNVFGDDYALQIARKDRSADRRRRSSRPSSRSSRTPASPTERSSSIDGNVMVRFADNETQLKARDVVKDEKTGLTKDYVNAMIVRVARAALDAGAGPARHAARPRPARRPLSSLPGGRRRRGRASCSTPTSRISAARSTPTRSRSPTSARSRSIRTSRTACACCCRRGADLGEGARRDQEGRSPISAAATRVVAEGAAVDCVLTAQQVRERRDFAHHLRTSPRCAIASTSSASPSPSCSARASIASSCSCPACRTPRK